MMRGHPIRRVRVPIVTISALALISPSAGAEERVLEIGRWYPSLEAGINITQSSYTDNWAGGDRGSVVWTLIVNGTLENQLDPKVNWYNTLKLAYGQTHQQVVAEDGSRSWEQPEKSTDLVDYETIFRFTLGGFIDPFVSGRFESQFQDASDPARALALNPLKFKETAGVARQWVNEEEQALLTRLGFSFRQSSRRIFQNPAPDDATRSETTNDGGLEFIADYKTKILDKRVAWTSKLSLYQPVFFSGKSDLNDLTPAQLDSARIDRDVADFSTTLDADWENIFTTQITKLISVQLYLRWIYDKYDNTVLPQLAFDEDGNLAAATAAPIRSAIRKAGQFKQTLSIGITYRFL